MTECAYLEHPPTDAGGAGPSGLRYYPTAASPPPDAFPRPLPLPERGVIVRATAVSVRDIDVSVQMTRADAAKLVKLFKCYAAPVREDWTARALATLERLALLRDGWKGARSVAPSKQAIQGARKVITAAAKAGLGLDRTVADSEGGVVFYAFGGKLEPDGGYSRHVAVLTSNEDDDVVIMTSARSEPVAEPLTVPSDAGLIENALRNLRTFLAE